MDLEKLWADRETPALKSLAVETPEELAECIRKAHKYLMDPERSGPVGYLYRKQVERNRELSGKQYAPTHSSREPDTDRR